MREGFDELQSLAAVLQGEHRYQEAWELYQRAFRLAEPIRDVTVAARAHCNFGVLPSKMGNFREATEEMLRAIALWGLAPMESRFQLAAGLTNLADLYCRECRWTDAEEPLRRARELVVPQSGAQHPVLYSILRAQAQVLRRTGKMRESRQVGKEADELLQRLVSEEATAYTVDVNSLR